MRIISLGLSWIFGLLFLIMGLVGMVGSRVVPIPAILISLLLLPPVRKLVYSKTNKKLSFKSRTGLILVLFLVLGGLSAWEGDNQNKALASEQLAQKTIVVSNDFKANRAKIISDLKIAIDSHEFKTASTLIQKYKITGDQELLRLEKQMKSQLATLERTRRTNTLLETLKGVPGSQHQENIDLYKKLAALNPGEQLYKTKIAHYENLQTAATKEKKLEADQERAAADRKKKEHAAIAVSKMRKNVDEMEGITWYRDKSTPKYTNKKSIHLYFGNKSGSRPWLRMRLQYAANDWLFIRSFFVVADGQRFDKNHAEFERDNGSGGIWEWYDESTNAQDIAMIRLWAISITRTWSYHRAKNKRFRMLSMRMPA